MSLSQAATCPCYHVLHNFEFSTHDGINPAGQLLYVNGAFYGTAQNGGRNSEGTVFTITPSGTYKTIYSFGSVTGDGAHPDAGLADLNGMLYGTTYNG